MASAVVQCPRPPRPNFAASPFLALVHRSAGNCWGPGAWVQARGLGGGGWGSAAFAARHPPSHAALPVQSTFYALFSRVTEPQRPHSASWSPGSVHPHDHKMDVDAQNSHIRGDLGWVLSAWHRQRLPSTPKSQVGMIGTADCDVGDAFCLLQCSSRYKTHQRLAHVQVLWGPLPACGCRSAFITAVRRQPTHLALFDLLPARPREYPEWYILQCMQCSEH